MSSVDTRIGISYDFNDRKYENSPSKVVEDTNDPSSVEETPQNGPQSSQTSEVSLKPQVHYLYQYNENDNFELLIAPALHHDFAEGGETNLDYDTLRGSFYKEIQRKWSVFGSNDFSLTNDRNEDSASLGEDTEQPQVGSSTQGEEGASPKLSEENGRTRYYRNNVNVDTRYMYGVENFWQVGGGYNILRYDSSYDTGSNDYDRYSTRLRNEHRFNSSWGTTLQVDYIRGEYEEETTVPIAAEERPTLEVGERAERPQDVPVSSDVSEYRFAGSVKNSSDISNIFIFTYDYIGAFYDDELRNNNTVHEARLTWDHRLSSKWNTSLALGPSYHKSERSDAAYGFNGLARLQYNRKRSTFTLQLDKRYDVKNFDGTDGRGAVDIWESKFVVDHQITKKITFKGVASYTNEQGEDIISASIAESGELVTTTDEYEKKTYLANIGLAYDFLENFQAGLTYSFSHLDAEQKEDSYDDHRVLMSLDWKREWFRW